MSCTIEEDWRNHFGDQWQMPPGFLLFVTTSEAVRQAIYEANQVEWLIQKAEFRSKYGDDLHSLPWLEEGA